MQIESWSQKGYFIEYTIIDQIQNGYKELVESKDMPPITYTTQITENATGEVIFDGSFDTLKEGLDKAFLFLSKRNNRKRSAN